MIQRVLGAGATLPRRLVPIAWIWLAAALCLLPGCEPIREYSDPLAVWSAPADDSPAHLFVALHVQEPGEPVSSFLLYELDPDDQEAPRPVTEIGGRLVGLRADAEALTLVMASGVVVRRTLESGAMERLQKAHAPVAFMSAAWRADMVFALAEASQEKLALYRWQPASGWESTGPLLELHGAPERPRLLNAPEGLLVVSRRSVGGRTEPGLVAFRFAQTEWIPVAVPVERQSDGAFALARAGQAVGLLREPDVEGLLGQRERLWLDVLRGRDWGIASGGVPLMDDATLLGGRDLALAGQGSRWAAVRVDQGAVRVMIQAVDGNGWNVPLILQQQTADENLSALLFVLTLFSMLLMLHMIRVTARQRVPSLSGTPRTISWKRSLNAGPAALMDRAVAMVIDLLLVFPGVLMFWAGINKGQLAGMVPADIPLLYGIWILLYSLYAAIAEAYYGRTLGKAMLGLRVRSIAAGPPAGGQVIIRNAARFVDFFFLSLFGAPMPYLVALFTILWTGGRQRVGDILAGTLVLYHTPLMQREIILASASPRRQELLGGLGISFAVQSSEIDETILPQQTSEENVSRIAAQKADAVARKLVGNEIIIAADTIVELHGEIIGKPRDDEDARAILRKLSGTTHTVRTAVAVIDRLTGQQMTASEVTEVDFLPLTEEEIVRYVDSGAADGKAGAYGIQDAGGRFVCGMRGSLTNVIGMPMDLLRDILEHLDA